MRLVRTKRSKSVVYREIEGEKSSAFFLQLLCLMPRSRCDLCQDMCDVGGQVNARGAGGGGIAVKRLERLQATIQQYNVRDTPDGGWGLKQTLKSRQF